MAIAQHISVVVIDKRSPPAADDCKEWAFNIVQHFHQSSLSSIVYKSANDGVMGMSARVRGYKQGESMQVHACTDLNCILCLWMMV